MKPHISDAYPIHYLLDHDCFFCDKVHMTDLCSGSTASGWYGVTMSASHAVGGGFTPQPGHTKDHHKHGTNCLPAQHADVSVGLW